MGEEPNEDDDLIVHTVPTAEHLLRGASSSSRPSSVLQRLPNMDSSKTLSGEWLEDQRRRSLRVH